MWNAWGKRFKHSNEFWYTFSSCFPKPLNDFTLPPAMCVSQFHWVYSSAGRTNFHPSWLLVWLPGHLLSRVILLLFCFLFVYFFLWGFLFCCSVCVFWFRVYIANGSVFMFKYKILILISLYSQYFLLILGQHLPKKEIQTHSKMTFSITFTIFVFPHSHS